MQLKQARIEDAEKLERFYKNAVESPNGMTRYSRWIYGIHPSDSVIESYIARRALYYLEDKQGIAAAAALTSSQDESYHPIEWKQNLRDDEVGVLHVMCVDPDRRRCGFARHLILSLLRVAALLGKKAVRLDALSTNAPAQRLYESLGFVKRGETRWYAENTNWADFFLYELPLRRVLYIGGSPCSGKSTVAARLAQTLGAAYFKADDLLDDCVRRAAEAGSPAYADYLSLSSDGVWMRDPIEQRDTEFAIYREIAPFLTDALQNMREDRIIAEGAAFTPDVTRGIADTDCVFIVPSPDFQIAKYRERPWIAGVLSGCSDKEQAFSNWMRRDMLFADRVKNACSEMGRACIVVDGTQSEDAVFDIVTRHFLKTETDVTSVL